jgi:hypothetical protein
MTDRIGKLSINQVLGVFMVIEVISMALGFVWLMVWVTCIVSYKNKNGVKDGNTNK